MRKAIFRGGWMMQVLRSFLFALTLIQAAVGLASFLGAQSAPENASTLLSLSQSCLATIEGSQKFSGLLKDVTLHPGFERLSDLGLRLAEGKQYACAIPAFEAALRLDPQSWEMHYNLALGLVQTGEPRRAASELQKVVQQKPDFLLAHNAMGLALQALGQLDAAADEFQAALRIDPHSALPAFNLAEVFQAQKKYMAEIYYLQQALNSSPSRELEFQARLALGAVHDEMGHADDAVAELRKLTAAFPDSAEAHLNLGNAYGRHLRFKEATVEYEQTLRLDPGINSVRLSLAKALLEMGEDTAAIPIVQNYTHRVPEEYEGYLVLGQAYRRQGDLAKAAEQLMQAVKLKPDSFEARYNLGVSLASGKDTDAAINELQAAEKLNPYDPGVHYELSRIYAKQKRLDLSRGETQAFEQARVVSEKNRTVELLRVKGDDFLRKSDAQSASQAYRQAIEIDPEDPGMHYNLSLALARLGDRQGEKQELEKAVQLGPNVAEAHNQLGTLDLAEGRAGEAEKEFKSAIALNPMFAEAKNNLGTLYGRLGKSRAATELFREAIQNDPQFAQAHANLGLALAADGDFVEAKRELEKALRIDPKNERALAGLHLLKAQSSKGHAPTQDSKKQPN